MNSAEHSEGYEWLTTNWANEHLQSLPQSTDDIEQWSVHTYETQNHIQVEHTQSKVSPKALNE